MAGILEIENVYTAYDKADVLQGISLKVEPGRITCLLGSNGSGKTTLVRSILGLTPSRAGRIVFDGSDITQLPTHRIIAAGIACIPEGRKVFPKLDGRGKSAGRRLPGALGQGERGAAWRDLPDFPAACRAADAARRHDVGRRTGDGIDRARPDVRAQAASDRRAFARPFAAPGEGEFQHHPRHQRAGNYGSFGRAKRASDARYFAPRLRSVERRVSASGTPAGTRPARTCAMPISGKPCSLQLN